MNGTCGWRLVRASTRSDCLFWLPTCTLSASHENGLLFARLMLHGTAQLDESDSQSKTGHCDSDSAFYFRQFVLNQSQCVVW